MGFISSFTPAGITKEEAEILKNELAALRRLVEGKQIKTEAWLSLILEKENLTQDKLDEYIRIIKSYGKQKGLKID